MGAGAMLQMQLTDDAELGPFVRQILNSSERAAQLTHNLLAFSRNQKIMPLLVDVNTVVLGMHDYLVRSIGDKIRLEISCRDELLPAWIDRGQIEQVLINLVANSSEAMPAGGALQLDTALVDSQDCELELDGCKSGSYAQITVTDTGSGMDAEKCSRIFDPFFTTKHIGYGAGMGLSMAYGIIKQHGGTIKVHSELNKGSVFFIYLPLSIVASDS
jgi:signal transduction histidine kinase